MQSLNVLMHHTRDVQHHGHKKCVYCVQVQSLGLQQVHAERSSVHRYIRRLMALPFLPHEFVRPMFDALKMKAGTSELKELVAYVEGTWLNSTVWPASAWSVFRQSVRTNNDAEGYHNRLGQRAHAAMSLYRLIAFLHDESLFVSVQCRLLSDRKLVKHQRKKYQLTHKRFHGYWEQLVNGEISAKDLLHACARVNGPVCS